MYVKVAIYHAILGGESGRSVAARFDLSHPTALKYADEAVAYIRELPAIAADAELMRFLGGNLKLQSYTIDPVLSARLSKLLASILERAEVYLGLSVVSRDAATVSVSAKVPEQLFYQFRRLVREVAKSRGKDVTVSSLLNEMIEQYVETGKTPEAEVKFRHSDLLMDELRNVLARHGVVDD